MNRFTKLLTYLACSAAVTLGCNSAANLDTDGGGGELDSCSTDNGGCDPAVTCTDSAAGPSCGTCPDGTEDVGGDGTECAALGCDSTEEAACMVASGGSCEATSSSYSCSDCPDGSVLATDDSACEADDSCPQGSEGFDACMIAEGGLCVVTGNEFECTGCAPGYTVNSTADGCEDIDECQQGAVGDVACEVATGGECTNAAGGYGCTACPEEMIQTPDGLGCEVPPVCGDGVTTGSEVCDDGNRVGGDGCRADCAGLEVCGDGKRDTATGEQCDDGNVAEDDGCSATCQLPPAETTIPTEVNILGGSPLDCVLTNSNTGRKVSVDQLGHLHAVLNCEGSAHVVSSIDLGITWSAPIDTGLTDVSEVAIEGGAPGTAYVAAITSTGLLYVETNDSGATWSTPQVLTETAPDAEVSIDSYEDDIFIAIGQASNMAVYRSVGAAGTFFTETILAQSNAFHEIIVDPATGNVLVATDTPDFHLRLSTDHGATYAAEVNPTGSAFFSDWTLTNNIVYVSGTGESPGNLDAIPLSDISSSSVIGDLPANTSNAQSRAIDSNAVGDVFVVSALASGEIQLDRLQAGDTEFLPANVRTLPAGVSPAVAALPSNDGAVVLYGDGTHIWATVQAYK